jgi:2-hydroxy-6-oxonona-2,4-dienedioate hydrolase
MARIKDLSMKAVNDPSWEMLKGRLEFLMYDKSKVNDDLVATRQRIYAQPGYADIMQRILCLQEMDIRRRNMITAEQYASITSPTLVIWTSHDPTATPEEGQQIADMIPGSEFVVMGECGHWPQFEDPATFNDIHLKFLTAG